MKQNISRRAFIASTVAAVAAPWVPGVSRAAGEPILLRCSLDTAPSHKRNVAFKDYLQKLEAASNGRIQTKLFESGQLFPDLQVAKALIQNQVEMACPGSWAITGIVPNCDIFQIPALYGRSADEVHKIMDFKAGKVLDGDIQQKLRSQSMGPWLDLGYENWYSTNRPLNSLADFKGLKIRNSGGAGQAWRARFVGGIPNTTPWPQVPLSLSQGVSDALVSTNESLVTAQLWDAGIKYAFEDHQFFAMYIPIVSSAFMAKLTPDLQKLVTGIWADNIVAYRAAMAEAQTNARTTLEAHQVKFTDSTPEQTLKARASMMPDQEGLAKELKLSPELVKIVMDGLPA